MIYKDELGFPVDKHGDGWDSAMRSGMLHIANHPDAKPITAYVYAGGELLRHPHQRPAFNRHNFSRAQLMCCLPGMEPDLARKVLVASVKRGFFAQNFQRDKRGSWKFPWPHLVDGEPVHFDFADPLLPNHIGALILTARLRWLYAFLPVAYAAHIVSVLLHSRTKGYDETTMQAECYLYGSLSLYRKVHKRWRQISWGYWNKRGEGEYHAMLERIVDKA